jgi:hypothetical protein
MHQNYPATAGGGGLSRSLRRRVAAAGGQPPGSVVARRGKAHPLVSLAWRRTLIGIITLFASLCPDYLTRYPDQLLGGGRQPFALARALVIAPDLPICDQVIPRPRDPYTIRLMEDVPKLNESA